MRTWARLRRERRCGKCGEPIKADDPAQFLSSYGQEWSLVRCVACAEGRPPADLPPAAPTDPPKAPAWTKLGDIRTAFKHAKEEPCD